MMIRVRCGDKIPARFGIGSMPQFERGLYEPGEDVRVFDGSEEDEDVEGSRLPLLIVLALLVLAMFAGFVWLAYSEGVSRGRSEIPVVTAEAGPARVAPTNPGGAATPYKGFKIYEQPAPPDSETTQDVSPRAPVDAKSAQPAMPAPAMTVAAPKPAQAMTAPPVPKPVVVAKAEAPAAKPVAPPAAAMSAAAKMAAATLAPKATSATPAPASTPAPKASSVSAQLSTPLTQASAPPRQLVANAPPPAPVAQTSAPSGAYVLQIGAYKSQADADTAWKAYKAKHAALLAGYAPNVLQANLGDKGTWYRLRIAGFSSKDVASALCDRLKADGGGCFLGK
jgi:cell division protein FtsN